MLGFMINAHMQLNTGKERKTATTTTVWPVLGTIVMRKTDLRRINGLGWASVGAEVGQV